MAPIASVVLECTAPVNVNSLVTWTPRSDGLNEECNLEWKTDNLNANTVKTWEVPKHPRPSVGHSLAKLDLSNCDPPLGLMLASALLPIYPHVIRTGNGSELSDPVRYRAPKLKQLTVNYYVWVSVSFPRIWVSVAMMRSVNTESQIRCGTCVSTCSS